MNFIRFYIVKTCIIFLLLSLQNCDSNCSFCNTESKGSGAIVLTFDDKYISDWLEADSIFSIYNWQATFGVTKYWKLNNTDIEKLKHLQFGGHEIASHGYNHIRSTEYLNNNKIEDYLNEEILPSLNDMRNDGFDISSFVYPYGERSVETDLTLFEYFLVLRGTTGEQIAQKYFVTQSDENMLVFGLGIDNHYDHFTISYILDLLKQANQENFALVLYGHKIADDDTSKYVTSYNTLHKICSFVEQNNMEFLTLRGLVNYNQ